MAGIESLDDTLEIRQHEMDDSYTLITQASVKMPLRKLRYVPVFGWDWARLLDHRATFC